MLVDQVVQVFIIDQFYLRLTGSNQFYDFGLGLLEKALVLVENSSTSLFSF